MYTVHVRNFDCFCLRLLLFNVQGPTCFNDLKIVDGVQYDTYAEACRARGLMENDNHWRDTMNDAVLCRTPEKIRHLFAI